MHDTCHAHVNSVARNDMQAEDGLEMKSSLWCQLTDLCEAGSWSSLPYLHGSRFLPETPPPGANVNTERCWKETNKQTATPPRHVTPFPAASRPRKARGAHPPLAPAPAGKPVGPCKTLICLLSWYVRRCQSIECLVLCDVSGAKPPMSITEPAESWHQMLQGP